MNRPHLVTLATEAHRLERLTAHLRINGKPLQSMALLLEAERAKDPLRPLLEKKAHD